MKKKKISVYNMRIYQNAAKELKIKIHEDRELYNAYGKHYFYRTTDKYILLTPAKEKKWNQLVDKKYEKFTPILTEEEKTEKWCKRLSKLTGISLEEAEEIAEEKLDYQSECAARMVERGNSYSSDRAANRCYTMAEKIERQNPLRRIQNEEHAQAILAASDRHNNTDYEDKLEEARELVASGELDREEVREYARTNMQ